MVLMRVRNKEKRLISNTVRAMEQIFVFDPVSKTSDQRHSICSFKCIVKSRFHVKLSVYKELLT